ncbi:tyrosine-type recombinase/integrase [Micromonospora sp. NPDC049060]|uniref:tyrosine-type recombinase/integrase n=1 Tax=Micromonospora sp. NPDC049060 TaxID=3154828 RepID=UPI0033D2002B
MPRGTEPARRGARRKVNGEGNIRQRKDGRWEGRAWVFTSDGREIRRSVYGSSWEEVHEKLTGLKAKAQAGIRVAGSIQSVADFMAYWQREVLQDRVRPSTLRTYEWLSRCYVVPLIGSQRLGKLQPPTIRTFLNRAKSTCQCCAQGKDAARRAAGKEARCCAKHPRQCCESYPSDGTIRHLHRMVRAALQDAVVDGLIAENPARNLRLAHRYRPRFTPLTGEEAKLLLKAARSDRLYALYAVALALGLRRGEALALRWQDVDLVDGVLFVRQSLQRLNGRLVFGPVKSDESERVIGLPPPCLAALRQHKLMQEAERKSMGDRWQDFGLIFTTGIGTPIEPRNLNRHFVRLLDGAGLRRVRFHDLRHSCATLLYEQGVPIEKIQDVLGHSSPTITKLIYVEVTRQAQRSTTDKLGYLFEA